MVQTANVKTVFVNVMIVGLATIAKYTITVVTINVMKPTNKVLVTQLMVLVIVNQNTAAQNVTF